MGTVVQLSFEGAEQLAGHVAELWRDGAKLSTEQAEIYAVAVCGGRIARLVFEAARERFHNQAPLLAHMHLFWADERCVPPDDPESNFRLCQLSFLSGVKLSSAQIHRIQGEIDPTDAANAISAETRAALRSRPDETPIFDLIILSMGEDGHVASLFPGSPESVTLPRPLYRAVVGSKPPPQRITLSYAAIAAAKRVVVMVSEQGKAEALRRSLEADGQTPLAKVLEMRHLTEIFTSFKA